MHKLSENLKTDIAMVAATLNSGGTASNTPLWVSMANYDALLALIQSATIVTGATVTAKLVQAKTDGGAYIDIAGKSVSFTAAEDDTLKTIDLRAEEMDVNNGYIYVGVLITAAGGQDAPMSAAFVRGRAGYAQAVLPA